MTIGEYDVYRLYLISCMDRYSVYSTYTLKGFLLSRNITIALFHAVVHLSSINKIIGVGEGNHLIHKYELFKSDSL